MAMRMMDRGGPCGHSFLNMSLHLDPYRPEDEWTVQYEYELQWGR